MNREIVSPGGAGVYPLTGDVTSTAGNAPVRVTGLQGVPVSPTSSFQGGEILEFNPNSNNWTPTLRAAIRVNGVTASDDYIVMVNAVPLQINGV